MTRACLVSVALLALARGAHAQHPLQHPVDAVELRFSRSQPVMSYTLRVDSADLTGYAVELRIRNAPDTFHLAMAAHPEYDDRYWRFLDGLRIEARGGAAQIAREDSSLWRISAPGGEAIVRYRLQLPAQTDPTRSAWRPFLVPTGGLVGGPHSFLYLVGAPLAPVHLTLELPSGWEAATGLQPTSDPRNRYLALAGLRARVNWNPAMGSNGQPAPDLRIRAWLRPGEQSLTLLLGDPASAWGRAGLHTGDQLISVNGSAIGTIPEFRAWLGRVRLDDTLRIEVRRPAGPWRTSVVTAGYERPSVRIEEMVEASERQRAIRTAWRAGAP
jgi:predicted metalloprotease with PDZ domain